MKLNNLVPIPIWTRPKPINCKIIILLPRELKEEDWEGETKKVPRAHFSRPEPGTQDYLPIFGIMAMAMVCGHSVNHNSWSFSCSCLSSDTLSLCLLDTLWVPL